MSTRVSNQSSGISLSLAMLIGFLAAGVLTLLATVRVLP